MIILGAGMAGCVAAIMNPRAHVLEGSTVPPDNHNAVLRFRNDTISKVTGIPFRKVLVRKSIWYLGDFHQPNPMLANLYSQKVSGKILPRSIWNVEPVERFVAPPDFHMMMLDILESRIDYGARVAGINSDIIILEGLREGDTSAIDRTGMPIISTIPMPVMVRVANTPKPFNDIADDFSHKPIYTERWRIEDCDVHQTIYFPDPSMSLYRATLTGGDLILESAKEDETFSTIQLELASEAFGLLDSSCQLIKSGEQKYGKIAPIDDGARKLFMFNLTQKLGIYSLGRFACWRNILLDDVYEDVFKIRRMLNQGAYDMRKEL